MAAVALAHAAVVALAERLRGGRVAVLTGAGVSTESGIPDYRSPEALARPRRPISGPEFVRSESLRRRYWARAMAGWDSFCRAAFEVPTCTACGGVLKPCVVFFGENVPRPVVDEAFATVDGADGLLVAGTSLAAVFSGYRFLRRAAERGAWIAIVNRGLVRGEEHAVLKIEASTGAVLRELADMSSRPGLGTSPECALG
jgi:NAD-dependent SIR2 family protein deacetylase